METVLYLGLYASIGGAERCLLELLGGLDRTRYRPLVVLAAEGPLAARLRDGGVEVLIEPFPAPPLHRLMFPPVAAAVFRAAVRLRGHVRSRGIRLLHCGDVLALLLLLPSALAGARVVYQVHYLGGGPRLLAFNLLALLAVDAIVAYSADQRGSLLRDTRGLSRKVVVVHPGIDAAPYARGDGSRFRGALGLTDGAPLVGLVGRYDNWKGHAVFLEAAARVRVKRPDARFVMVGGALNRESLPHVARYQRDILARRSALALEDAVLTVDHREDVADVLAGLDVLVCPSEHEPFGMVVVEALAAGTPVVASDSGGPAEIIEDGRSGLLCPTGAAAAFAECVLRLLEDRSLAASLAERGKERVRSAFGRQRYVRQIEAVYDRLA